jgi:hypothetical protein
MVKFMRTEDMHVSDQDLVLAADGELTAPAAARVEAHLAACWTCRARKQEIEGAVGEFVRTYRRAFDARLPSSAGPRALLKARLSQLAATQPAPRHLWFQSGLWRFSWALLGAVACLAVAIFLTSPSWIARQQVQAATMMIPDPTLTPGATVFMGREEVCRASNTKNKVVPATLQRQVFEEYGIHPAQPRAYEVDYLITPALGGADDIHNLWPESYGSTMWNAAVKDALEDHLRNLVCAGKLDLATAQQEIAANWIDAYKKYFHTDRPLAAASREMDR